MEDEIKENREKTKDLVQMNKEQDQFLDEMREKFQETENEQIKLRESFNEIEEEVFFYDFFCFYCI